MIQIVDIKISADRLNDHDHIRTKIQRKLEWSKSKPFHYKLLKRSIDARKNIPLFQLRYQISPEKFGPPSDDSIKFVQSEKGTKVIIVGSGPAGYFAALQCIELGLKPVILERGKDVKARRRDLKAIQQMGVVNPHSNYCFGEGGAGTYSDGKLYTRSKKRGDIIKTLQLLVDHGAKTDILIDAHPHIGSNKLPGIIENIRMTIEKYGGEVHFNSYVTDIILDKDACRSVVLEDGREVKGDHFIIATGHSARDIFKLFHDKQLLIESKPFAIGVRVEHPQALIDEIQYNQNPREENLPASSYSMVCQIQNKGVFSFCMCPGGLIVPSATAPGEILVNGMSLSRRDSPFANSGIVTELSVKELQSKGFDGVFGNMNFQASLEQKMFEHGDGSQKAPAQNLIDFVNGQSMLQLNDCSYIPGIYQAPLHELLPTFIYERLRDGLLNFSLRMKGYFTDQANIVALEGRTSSPVKIPRSNEMLCHPQVVNLYPCGEGAGYAGGILSAAMDGQRVVQAIYKTINSKALNN